MGQGIGRQLFDRATETARGYGAYEAVVKADPEAVPFYEAMGCARAGSMASGSVPVRSIPRLVFALRDVNRAEGI